MSGRAPEGRKVRQDGGGAGLAGGGGGRAQVGEQFEEGVLGGLADRPPRA
ncbi:hypothetical protein ACFSTC_31145 [Nonomuraea ferruginea]